MVGFKGRDDTVRAAFLLTAGQYFCQQAAVTLSLSKLDSVLMRVFRHQRKGFFDGIAHQLVHLVAFGDGQVKGDIHTVAHIPRRQIIQRNADHIRQFFFVKRCAFFGLKSQHLVKHQLFVVMVAYFAFFGTAIFAAINEGIG